MNDCESGGGGGGGPAEPLPPSGKYFMSLHVEKLETLKLQLSSMKFHFNIFTAGSLKMRLDSVSKWLDVPVFVLCVFVLCCIVCLCVCCVIFSVRLLMTLSQQQTLTSLQP